MPAKFHTFQMQPEFTNSVLIESNGLAAIFDPWGQTDDWIKLLGERGLTLSAIYCTHGHFDHIMTVPGLVAATGAPWYMHHADLPVVKDWSNQILTQMGSAPVNIEKMPPHPLAHGTINILPDVMAEVIHLPGHSAGGVGFYFNEMSLLIVGDTLFQDSYGRTDLITASESQIIESLSAIAARNFPDDTIVIHGHGPNTTIKYLRENNPYFKKL